MKIWLTGCTSGLGRALVDKWVDAGYTVVGGGRNKASLESLRRKHPQCYFFPLDVSREDSVEGFCSLAREATQSVDLLINNAAIINHPRPLWQIPAEEFDELTAININGVVNMIRAVVPLMLAQGQGIIVNFSSGWGRSTSPEVAPYCASKWAIEGLSQSLSQELPKNLACIALNPGVVNTEMLQKAYGKAAEEYPNPAQWAEIAAPFIASIRACDNGAALTVGQS